MHRTARHRQGTRLRQLLVLLLLALALLAGVSVSHTHGLHAQTVQTETVRVPALKRVHELARQVDEQRGMAALHLTLQDEARRADIEERLQLGRKQIERRMAAFARQLTDAADHGHHRAVAASLADFWAAQDRLLAASRRAAADAANAAHAEQARALLTGESQAAFLRLRADIDAWWTALESAAMQQAQQARLDANLVVQLVWAGAALAALALSVGWAVMRWPLAAPLADAAAGRMRLQAQAQLQDHLQALNDAVAAARRGEPGRAAGLSAQEARQLADRVATAAQGLRRLVGRAIPPGAAAPPDADGAPGDHQPQDDATPR